MRPIMLTLMPLLFSLGCAGPGVSVTDTRADLRQKACSPHEHAVENTERLSEPCRFQRIWFEEVGTALGGFATAVRVPNQ